jgi:hypothetical protein
MNQEQVKQGADEFEELGHRLLEHARYLRSHASETGHKRPFWPESTGDLGLTAEMLFEVRRQRLRHLDGSILGEPTWDMLLILFMAFKARTCVTVGQVCQSSGIFPSTARRWLAVLADQGLIDVGDGGECDQSKPVQLSELGEIRMTKILLDLQGECLKRGWSGPGTA